MLAARTYAATGDTQSAERFLRRIIEKDPSYLQAYSALGQLYLPQRRLDAALTEFEAMATRDPKPVAALTLAGIILQAQGKESEAKAKFERVMQLDSSAPVAANNLAWMMAESGGNLDVALQLAQTAQRGLPDSTEVADTLGFVYYKKDLLPQAIQAFKTTVEKKATRADYHYRLAWPSQSLATRPPRRGTCPRLFGLNRLFNRQRRRKPSFRQSRLKPNETSGHWRRRRIIGSPTVLGMDRRYALSGNRISRDTGFVPEVDFESGPAQTVPWIETMRTGRVASSPVRMRDYYQKNYAWRETKATAAGISRRG